MTLDVSLEAIEADLAMAERGGQVAVLALARAQVRATLLASSHRLGAAVPDPVPAPQYGREGAVPDIVVAQGPDADVYTVPKAAPWDDRVTAAAMLLKVPEADLFAALEHLGELTPGFAPVERMLEPPAEVPDEDELAAPDLEDSETSEAFSAPRVFPDPEDIDVDFFAEAKKARKKK